MTTNNDIKQTILNLISSKPKHFSVLIKGNEELINWVNDNCNNRELLSISEKIYSAINDSESNICKNGNTKKYLGISDGYGYCGKSKVCQCLNEIQSAASKEAHSSKTVEEKAKTNERRAKTTLERYGCVNVGQTSKAKESHSEFYANKDKVSNINSRIKATKLENYGNENYNGSDKRYENYSKLLESKSVSFVSSKEEFSLTSEKYRFKCNSCNNEFESYISTSNLPFCFSCNPDYSKCRSKEEKEIYEHIKQIYTGEVVLGSRSVVGNGSSVDFYLPEKNIAIEYNGLYWHCIDSHVPHITKHYHYNKYLLCKENGVDLITIYGHLFQSNKDLILNRLSYKLGLSDSNKIYARKCVVKEITDSSYVTFLEKNHIQGNVPAKIRLGLYFDNELVSVMTLSNSSNRNISGSNRYDYELLRFASSKHVVGAATKLFSYFVNTYNPDSVVTYSQNEWNSGNVYSVMGFNRIADSGPGYWYVSGDYTKVLHRTNFTKSKLVKMGHDKSKTESEIMNQLGYHTLWDCGNSKWVWTKTN